VVEAPESATQRIDPPDPGHAHSLDELVGCLRALKVWAGDPSYDTITRRINSRWTNAGSPGGDLARKNTVADCFKTGRRRINGDLVVSVVQALRNDTGYVAHWRQALRVSLAEAAAIAQVRVLGTLPDDVATFVGRRAEIDRVSGEPDGRVYVLSGMAGVGKTQLAVHIGRTLSRQFDTTLFVDLRGFHPDPQQPPVAPAAVLDGFLRVLGVPGRQIPHSVEARSAVFRERLADRRALVVLDNAIDAEQVQPLLPLGARTLTLVTSRRRLGALDTATHLDVALFSEAEAEQFLSGSVPSAVLGADHRAYKRIASRCGHLPLALGVVAGQMAGRPDWTVTDHADRLDEQHQHRRLDSGVHLALGLSYRHLPEQRQALLRRIAVHPGPDLDAHAAAALLDTDPATAEAHLAHLLDDHVLLQPIPGRYDLHDLVRSYAADLAYDEDRPAERRESLGRLLDHYLYTAAAAMDVLYPAEGHRRPVLPSKGRGGPRIGDVHEARRWLDAERGTLVAVCGYAARNGWPEHAVRLAGTLYTYLDNGGYPADAFTVHTEAQHAAHVLGDGIAEANALTNLGVAYWQAGRHSEAIERFLRAQTLARRFGDLRGEARALGNLGVVHSTTGQFNLSANFHQRALDRFVQLGDLVGEANTLTNLGSVFERLGRQKQALDPNRRALRIFRDLRHRGGEATALNNLGDVQVQLEQFADAADSYEQALAIFREIGERYGETCALNGLGHALAGQGRPAEAIARHTEALALATEIDKQEEQQRANAALARLYA
jgi:tetratricopeptide (TPR) repeat protein